MNLEDFIKNNREKFDSAEPNDAKIWAAVEQNLPRESAKIVAISPRQNIRKMWAAAASLLLIGGVLGFYFANSGSFSNKSAPVALENIAPEAAEATQYYARQISMKSEQLRTENFHDEQIEADLATLDRAMSELQIELAEVPPARREQVVSALIENYQIKLKILEKVLRHIETPVKNNPAVADSLTIQKTSNHVSKNI
jgi:hypothetical protein